MPINQQLLQAMRRQSSVGVSPYTPKKEGLSRFIPESIKGLGETLAGTIGARTGAGRLSEQARQKNIQAGTGLLKAAKKATGERKKRLLQQARDAFKESGMQIEEIQRTLDKSDKKILGEVLGTAGWLAIGAAPSKAISSPLSRIAWGSLIGAGTRAKGALEQEKEFGEVGKEAVKGGITGGIIAGAFELVGWGLRKIVDSRTVGRLRGETFTRELQPPTKDLARQIEMGWSSVGDDVANATDDLGKPLYKGSYKQIQSQAQKEIKSQSLSLKQLFKEHPKVKISPSFNFKRKLIDKLEDIFGGLDDLQKTTVKKEISRWIPGRENLTDVLKIRQTLDKKIPSGYWLDPNAQRAFLGHVRYTLRTLLKEGMEDSIGGTVVKEINKKISLAMDVRHLAALQQAIRQKGALPFTTQARGIIATLLDKTIFNPQITTRVAQAGKGLGPISPNVQGRNIIINQLIKLLSGQ